MLFPVHVSFLQDTLCSSFSPLQYKAGFAVCKHIWCLINQPSSSSLKLRASPLCFDFLVLLLCHAINKTLTQSLRRKSHCPIASLLFWVVNLFDVTYL